LKTPEPELDFLTFEEAARLVMAAEAEWRPMILLALRTGLSKESSGAVLGGHLPRGRHPAGELARDPA
jgi:hypothetical protein